MIGIDFVLVDGPHQTTYAATTKGVVPKCSAARNEFHITRLRMQHLDAAILTIGRRRESGRARRAAFIAKYLHAARHNDLTES
jgi:hypothetical protein